MFLAKKNQVKDKTGKTIEEGLCASLSIGMHSLSWPMLWHAEKEDYKTLICQDFSKGIIYVLKREGHHYILGNLLYPDLFNWLEENLADMVEASNLFEISLIVKVDNAERSISVRDLFSDRIKVPKDSLYCLADFLTSRLESAVEDLM